MVPLKTIDDFLKYALDYGTFSYSQGYHQLRLFPELPPDPAIEGYNGSEPPNWDT